MGQDAMRFQSAQHDTKRSPGRESWVRMRCRFQSAQHDKIVAQHVSAGVSELIDASPSGRHRILDIEFKVDGFDWTRFCAVPEGTQEHLMQPSPALTCWATIVPPCGLVTICCVTGDPFKAVFWP